MCACYGFLVRLQLLLVFPCSPRLSLSRKHLETSTRMVRLPISHMLHELCVLELLRKDSSGCCPLCWRQHAGLTPAQALLDRAAVHGRRKEYSKRFRLCFSETHDVDPHHASTLCSASFVSGMYAYVGADVAATFFARYVPNARLLPAYSLLCAPFCFQFPSRLPFPWPTTGH